MVSFTPTTNINGTILQPVPSTGNYFGMFPYYKVPANAGLGFPPQVSGWSISTQPGGQIIATDLQGRTYTCRYNSALELVFQTEGRF